MLARLFVLIGGLIVLALTVALVGPYFVDWTSYRADFEREASAILGRKVTVEGDATARLLPFPSVTFSDVSVAGGPDGKPAMTVETFSMDAELAPFMRGEFLIFDMRLVRPRMTVSVDGDGVVDWAMRPSSPFDLAQISVEKLTITEGRVDIRHAAGGRDHLLSEINAEVSARSLAGPWRAQGSLRVDGLRTALAVSTGRVDEDGALRLRLRGEPQIYPLSLESDGDVRFKDGALRYAGSFHIEAQARSGDALRAADGETFRLRQDTAKAGETGRKAPAPYRLSGKFAFDHEKLDFEEFRFETGPQDNPYVADGKAVVDLGVRPRFSIEANGAQVRFDETIADADAASALTLQGRLAALQRVLEDLPKPTIPGTVEVRLPAVVAGDTTIRDVEMSAEPAAAGWTINALSATLPGRTTLEGSGLLRTGDDFGFTGSLLLAVAQPSGFAAWLSRDIDDAIRRLPAAGFKADVDLNARQQRFSNLELVLGKARFEGEIDRRLVGEARPSTTVRLNGGALDVDGLAAFASLFVSDRGASHFADEDLDLAVKAGPVGISGLTAETVDTALRLRGGRLEIDRLSVGGLGGARGGATLSATGTLRDMASSPSGKLDASVVAVDLAPLVTVLADRYPQNRLLSGLSRRAAAYPGLLADARVDMVVSGAPDEKGGEPGVALSANGSAGGSAFSLTVSGEAGDGIDPAAPLSVALTARNDNAEALMALYGLPALPLGLVGGADTSLSLKGTLDKGFDAALEFTSQELTASYKGTLRITEDGPEGEGAATLEAADIEPWLMTAGLGLPGMGMGMPAEFSADASFGKQLVTFSKIAGTIDEGKVAGDVNAEIKDGRPYLTGAVSIDTLDLWPMMATVLGEAALQGGEGTWPKAPFRGDVAAPVGFNLDISAGAVSAGVFGTAEAAMMTVRLDHEGLRISNLAAKALGGTLEGLGEIKNNDGTALLSGQMKLSGADIGALLDGSGIAGKGDVTANLSGSGKSVEGLIASLSGSGSATFGATSIPGLNPNALPALIARADAIGRDVDAARTAVFAPPIVDAGTFPAASGEIAFTVAGGVLRAPPLTLDSPAATLTAELKADFADGTVAASGEIAYAPGDEALVGSEPVVRYTAQGPLGAIEKRLDTQPLAQFLTQRALEIEQARVEAMQAALLEKQRLRREVRYYAALQDERERVAEEKRRAAQRIRDEALARAEAERQAAEDALRAEEAKAADEARKAEAARAAEALRQSERDKARQDKAEQEKARQQKTKPDAQTIERAPLPDVRDAPAPTDRPTPTPSDRGAAPSGDGAQAPRRKTFDPLSIESFLKSLSGVD